MDITPQDFLTNFLVVEAYTEDEIITMPVDCVEGPSQSL
jgi:hypothetical protein